MINEITKEQYPDIWDSIVEDIFVMDEKEHRRGSNFYTNFIYEINMELKTIVKNGMVLFK